MTSSSTSSTLTARGEHGEPEISSRLVAEIDADLECLPFTSTNAWVVSPRHASQVLIDDDHEEVGIVPLAPSSIGLVSRKRCGHAPVGHRRLAPSQCADASDFSPAITRV